jgi:hypothetical protein
MPHELRLHRSQQRPRTAQRNSGGILTYPVQGVEAGPEETRAADTINGPSFAPANPTTTVLEQLSA